MRKITQQRFLTFPIFFLLILSVLGLFYYEISNFKNEIILNYLNSPLFSSAITIFVGLTAFLIYKQQKDDLKKDAANIILVEIQNAERQIKEVKKYLQKKIEGLAEMPEDIKIMPSENWTKYQYLFIREFDRDEWESILDFYHNCKLLDIALRVNRKYFFKNTYAYTTNIQKITANYILEYLTTTYDVNNFEKNLENEKKLRDKIDKFTDLYINTARGYTPNKATIDAKYALSKIEIISTSSIGQKLKMISDIQ